MTEDTKEALRDEKMPACVRSLVMLKYWSSGWFTPAFIDLLKGTIWTGSNCDLDELMIFFRMVSGDNLGLLRI